ncbi:MAG TPA: bifunctional diaminohydroxyphosphoribosylaminopyrimidine deaminase/5-amino-6-(5-phosphoribosylamino)uracil reductase RibD [Chthoniobacterales bacterium]|jgi:diaminohydroxyphosphoribosylaminopyrimidine deaminase/5-amino-6-(5-phosphoribosylamino)uracil reductase|nr:bifunctional diaminohydroxyphosphoribosylaminopyrimidine deaminase/5-amino-6-(5-phosphoribosylamino)uracil reductase RibD [Chthoniobacterales bacterium]
MAKCDEKFMRVALTEARKGVGLTSPNPAVGAVLVVKNKIVARGHHRRAGSPHAEVECLTNFGRTVPAEATLYVTLEPCSTIGRTGACTDAIIAAGVRRLVVGAVDPNPKHSGRGLEQLRKAGLEVQFGVLENESIELNEPYNKWIVTGIPFVIAKCGMSLDGRLTAPPSESRWLTSAAARGHAQRLRARVDAILVGAETIRADNPRLTVRGHAGAQQPWRIILSRSGKLPRHARVFTDRFAERTTVHRDTDLRILLSKLGAKKITSVLIEGGGDVLGQALDQRLIDKVQVYTAPIFAGGPVIAFAGAGADATPNAARLHRIRYEKIAGDICVTGYPMYPEKNS